MTNEWKKPRGTAVSRPYTTVPLTLTRSEDGEEEDAEDEGDEEDEDAEGGGV